ncbi:unnamed protein product [Pleuronectes platessa]|uniref:Uncharacterized protein n=1 Tax=Pleuronectes platessa TaxID=8262 RepID=A0A9N7TJQ2_PLEPL|nr:unnamed protein product [Pleuronectes platessa]
MINGGPGLQISSSSHSQYASDRPPLKVASAITAHTDRLFLPRAQGGRLGGGGGDSADPRGSHRRVCPLAQTNEIILGEVMLKMNRPLPIPHRHAGHMSPAPCAYAKAIHRLPSRRTSGFTQDRHGTAQPPDPNTSTRQEACI